MAKIMITEAGVAPSENVIQSMLACPKSEELVGIGRNPAALMHSKAHKKYQVPYAKEQHFKKALIRLLQMEQPDLALFQNDVEIVEVSRFREDIMEAGTKLFMPAHDVLEKCVDKSKSQEIWQSEGVKVPKALLIHDEQDLKKAFDLLGNEQGEIWLRATVGAGGRGALPTNDFSFAKLWIDRFNGWGSFTAAEMLTKDSVTWLSIWHEGDLVVAQTRRRKAWNFANRTLSGVTGITGVAETHSDAIVDRVSIDSIQAIDKKPHGVYGVDLTYDRQGFPNPTEINMRFFTTVHFFTKAGLNMPKIYKDIVLHREFPSLEKKINPLPDGLLWIRDMDREPLLTTEEEIARNITVIQ